MKLNSYLFPALLALLLHGVVFFILADVWFEPEKEIRRVPRHVNAQIVDLKSITTSADRKRQAEAAKKRANDQAKQKKQAEQKRKKVAAEKKRQKEIARKKAVDKKRKQDAAKKQAAEKKRKQEIAQKKAAEKKRKADAKRQKELAAKTAADKKAAEERARQKAEAEKKRKEQDALAAEQRKKAEAEERRRAAADKARQSALASALDEEEAQLAAEEGHQAAVSYEAYVREQISRYWRRSASARNGMIVELSIRLLPSGEVDDAFVSKSSGDDRFDRDAVRAVMKAASFPELQKLDPVVFDRYYRKFTMIFRPEDLRR